MTAFCHQGGWTIVDLTAVRSSDRGAHMGARELEAAQAGLDLGAAHEQLPEQAGAVVLDHRHDRALVDREMPAGVPVVGLAGRVYEAVLAPDVLAELIVKMP